VFHDSPAIGFLAHARKFGAALAEGKILAPAKSLEQMGQVVFNDYVDATLALGFLAVVLSMVVYGVLAVRKAVASDKPTAVETGVVETPSHA
jgi:carbon starvation protein